MKRTNIQVRSDADKMAVIPQASTQPVAGLSPAEQEQDQNLIDAAVYCILENNRTRHGLNESAIAALLPHYKIDLAADEVGAVLKRLASCKPPHAEFRGGGWWAVKPPHIYAMN